MRGLQNDRRHEHRARMDKQPLEAKMFRLFEKQVCHLAGLNKQITWDCDQSSKHICSRRE